MRSFSYLFVLALIILTLNANAQTNWHKVIDKSAGVEPVSVFTDENNVNVICAGFDANFNGIQDDGDLPPSWWRTSVKVLTSDGVGVNDLQKVRDFEFGNIGFPFRAGFLKEENKMFISHMGRIRCFNTTDGSIIEDTVVQINANAVSVLGDRLFLSVRESQEKNYVIVYDHRQHKALDTLEADINVQQTQPLGETGVAVLSEGDYTGGHSTLRLYQLSATGHTLMKNLDVGKGANHVISSDALVVVTLNGSHEIKIIDLEKLEITNTIPMPTNDAFGGYNGPRESIIEAGTGKIFTGAYNGKVYISDPATAKIVDSLESHGKVESLAALENLPVIITANSFLKDSYAPDSTITVFSTITSVSEGNMNPALSAALYPNPVIDNATLEINIPESFNMISVEVISATGKIISRFGIQPMGSGRVIYDLSSRNMGLTSGAYYLRISAGAESAILPFSVVR